MTHLVVIPDYAILVLGSEAVMRMKYLRLLARIGCHGIRHNAAVKKLIDWMTSQGLG